MRRQLFRCGDSHCSAAVVDCGAATAVSVHVCWNLVFQSSSFIAGKKEIYPSKKKGQPPEEVYLGMSCKNVRKLGGYTLSGDNPKMFTDKSEFMAMDREFPNEDYPEGADMDTVPVPAPSTSSGETSSAVQQAKDQTKSMLVKMHTELVKMATKAGITDLCALDKEDRVENVLLGVTSKDLRCKFCDKSLSTVTHLKNHIRGMHLHKTAHFCKKCNRYFSEATTLRRHEAKHDEAAPKFRCGTCQKEFASQSKLDDHSDVHRQGKPYTCQHCSSKSFRRVRALKAHEAVCDNNPSKLPRVKCRLCPKDFKERRLMKRHFKAAHPGEDPDL